MKGNHEQRRDNEEFERRASDTMNQIYRHLFSGVEINSKANHLKDKTLTVKDRVYPIEEKHRTAVRDDMLIELQQ